VGQVLGRLKHLQKAAGKENEFVVEECGASDMVAKVGTLVI